MITRGVSLDMDERERLGHSIADHPVLVLRNHGLLATGRNIAEAFSLTYHFERSGRSAAEDPGRHRLRRQDRRPSPETANAKQPSSRCSSTRRVLVGNANGRRCCLLRPSRSQLPP